jgi:DNA invertase Pin-like site-specific DNA recombinase
MSANTIHNDVIIYCRISTLNPKVKQHNNTSLSVQEKVCRDYCSNSDYTVSNVITEVSSAYNKLPTRLNNEVIHPNNSGKRVVIYAVDRFSRNTDFGYQLLKEAKKYNIVIDFVSDSFTTANDRHILQIKAEILRAEHESRITGTRIKELNKIKRAKGWVFGSKAPYGYKFKMINGIRKHVPNHNEQPIVKFILCASQNKFKLTKLNCILRELLPNNNNPIQVYNEKGDAIIKQFYNGQSNKDIADLLNSYSIRNRYGGIWRSGDILRIIRQNKN